MNTSDIKNKGQKLVSAALVIACVVLFYATSHWPVFINLQNKAYSYLLNTEYKLRPPPAAIKDIVIVAIDNETVLNMPSRWPYPRADFAKVIEHIKNANPRAIGIDFAYLGQSTPADDLALTESFNDPRLVLAATINEYGYLDTSYTSALKAQASYGVVTKLQDDDGIIRRNLLYLINTKKNAAAFLSWEMQILKNTRGIDVNSLEDRGNAIAFHSTKEQWIVPVDPSAKSFLIHFRAHTKDFELLSFYKVMNNDFDAAALKDKIVLIGVLPALFQDIQNTAFGWIPGVILNANAFLALYTHDFLKKLPVWPQYLLILIYILSTRYFLPPLNRIQSILLTLAELSMFLTIALLSLMAGYVLDYITFPCAIALTYLFKK